MRACHWQSKVDAGVPARVANLAPDVMLPELPLMYDQRRRRDADVHLRGTRATLTSALALLLLLPSASYLPAADFAALRTLEPGADAGTIENSFAAEIRVADGNARGTLEEQLIAVATDASATIEGRRLACRILRLVATERTAAALAPMLADPTWSDHARLVVEGIASPVADLALIAALGKTDGEARRSVIASLAARETGAAVVPLAEFATRGDEATAATALHALAAIARDARDASLIAALPLAESEALLIAQQEAFFSALTRLVKRGVNLDTVVIPFPKMQARTAEVADLAVRVMLQINPAQAVPQIVAMLQTDDPDFHRRAAAAIALLPDAAARLALVARAAEVPGPAWPLLIGGLADRGGPEIRPLARAGLSATDEPTKLAALDAIGRIGEAADAPELLQITAAGGAVGRAALAALTRLPDRQADPVLIAELERADSPVRASLPDVIAARNIRAALPVLLAVAATAERRLAAECYGAAGKLGDVSLMPELWERWTKATAADRPAVERALVAIARGDDSGAATHAITTRWKKGDATLRAAVIRMAGGAGDTAAIEFLRALVEGKKPNEAAVRTLAAWRTHEGFPVLRQLLEAGKLPAAMRLVVWNGMFDFARERLRSARWEAEEYVEACMQLATRPEDRERVLAAVVEGESEEQLRILDKWVNDPQLGAEVAAARHAMRQRFGLEE
jgi:HEAT repeat protein